jgi:hypothetical protein
VGHTVSKDVLFVTLEGVEGVEPASGEWVAIKPKLGVGDRAVLRNQITRMRPAGGDGSKAVVDIQIGDFNKALMVTGIVRWHLVEDDGSLLECTPEQIYALDEDDPLVDRVLGELATRNPIFAQKSKRAG